VADVMLSEFIPQCPRLHPGMMVPDDSRYDREWFCRVCGTRLYGNDQGGAELPQISPEQPTKDMGNLTGKPRNNATHYQRTWRYNKKFNGGRDGGGGKWYE